MKTAVITGGNTGLGYALAESLCKQGNWHLIIASRNLEKAKVAIAELSKVRPDNKVEVLPTPLDLLSMESVRNYATQFPYPHIDLLVLNAGASILKYQKSQDGIEATFAGNHLGHFQLTLLLLAQNKLSPSTEKPTRVVTIGSGMHNPKVFAPSKDFDFKFDFENVHGEKFDSGELEYDATLEYRKSKLASVWFCYELDRYVRRNELNIVSVALCPGFVPTTGLKRDHSKFAQAVLDYIFPLLPFTTPLSASVKHMTFVATTDRLDSESGSFYLSSDKGKISKTSEDSYNEELSKKMWNLSAKLTGLSSFKI